jgi:hypothetical protein
MKRISANANARLELLRSAPLNAWIAISREDNPRIVGIGESFTEADQAAKRNGATSYFLTKTPDAWLPRAFRVI